jgi:serine/threonine-protein kinase
VPETPSPPIPTTGAVPPGLVLGRRYVLGHLLARGGMADVWQATDNVLNRQVAVKILHPHLAEDTSFVDRFRIEALAAARLHHPSIVAIFDTCSEPPADGRPGVEAIVMELVKGHTLRHELDTHGAMDPMVAVNLGADVADALHAAHNAGLVHRDIKPANILLCDDQRVMITDFGIAKIRDDADHTQTGIMLGSVKYLAPEQVESKPVDGRTDVYALGVVLYEAVCGKVPFDADTPAATALARLHTTPPHPRQIKASVPPALDAVVMKAIEREADQRYATAAEMRVALLATRSAPQQVDPDITQVGHIPRPTAAPGAGLPAGGTAAAHPGAAAAPAVEPLPQRRRRWGLVLVTLAFVIAALGVAGFLISRTDGAQDLVGGGEDPTETTVVASGDPIPIVGIKSLDPPGGDGSENDNLAPRAVDEDPASAWSTDQYDSRTFGNLKTGVGVYVELADTGALGALEVASPTKGWAAQVYVADQPGATLADWGEPVTEQSGIPGNATFDLGGTEGRFVLLWLTDLGDGPPRVFVEVTNLEVIGA